MATSALAPQVGRLARGARYALAGLAYLFAVGAIAQVFLVGLSTFESATYWTDHVDFGRMLGIPALLIPVAALLGRGGPRLTGISFAVTGLYIAQMFLANVDNGYIGALHALNAFALIGTSFQTGSQAIRLVRPRPREQGSFEATAEGAN